MDGGGLLGATLLALGESKETADSSGCVLIPIVQDKRIVRREKKACSRCVSCFELRNWETRVICATRPLK
jgi:ribosomal protein S27AE